MFAPESSHIPTCMAEPYKFLAAVRHTSLRATGRGKS